MPCLCHGGHSTLDQALLQLGDQHALPSCLSFNAKFWKLIQGPALYRSQNMGRVPYSLPTALKVCCSAQAQPLHQRYGQSNRASKCEGHHSELPLLLNGARFVLYCSPYLSFPWPSSSCHGDSHLKAYATGKLGTQDLPRTMLPFLNNLGAYLEHHTAAHTAKNSWSHTSEAARW